MNQEEQTRYIVYDTESVVDGALMSRVLYQGEQLDGAGAIDRYLEDVGDPEAFIPVSFHVPVAIAVARVSADFRLLDISCLDDPEFDSIAMTEIFWKGVSHYKAVLVDFNGRGFDLPLMTLNAFRFGVSCPAYFRDDRFGYRYRFTDKHIDLMDWMTEYGAARLCQIIGNWFGGTLSLGVGKCRNMDTDNGDNGTYVVDLENYGWKVVRSFHNDRRSGPSPRQEEIYAEVLEVNRPIFSRESD